MQSLLTGVNTEKVEVIFIDDCCPEQSINICELFITEHRQEIKFKFEIIKQLTNQGLSISRNEALKVAKGQYIGFIDSDDAISPEYWNTLSDYVNNQQYDIIEFDFEEFTDTLPNHNLDEIIELPSSNLNPFYYDFFVWKRLYKKEVVENLCFPEGMIYEDIFYNVHAFAKAQSTVRLSASLVYYRKREGSTTALRTSQYSQLLINLVTASKDTIKVVSQQQELVSLLQKRCLLSMLKGLKIVDKYDRKKYYQLCSPSLLSVNELSKKYGSNVKSKASYFLARIVCRALK